MNRAALVREPLVHFVALGAVLWAGYAHLQAGAQRPRIALSAADTSRLADRYRQQYGTSPSARELTALIDHTLTEEMAYREALRLGLDRNDEIVRRRLIQKYQFLEEDLSTPPAPTEAQLRDFYARHAERYVLPPRLSFTHVYFSPDRRGEAGARNAAAAAAAALNRLGVSRAPDRGDPYPGPADFVALTPEEIARVFGREGLSQVLVTADPGRWTPASRSGYGWHTAYVSGREPARAAPFEAVRDRVAADVLAADRERRQAAAIAKLRGRFEIVRE